MKTSDISNTHWVRKYGLQGAKRFARLWFSFMCAFLAAVAAAFWVVAPEFATGWKRIFYGCLAGGLVVLAASRLTRMRLQYLGSH